MKQLLLFSFALFALLFVSCGYDDSAIIDRIENLENAQNSKIATLQQQIDAINDSIVALEVAKVNLEEHISDVQADADANAEDIAELQKAKTTLEERIATLQSYVDTELQNAKDWATATFATLEQYNALAEDVAELKETVDGLDEVLKNWVNEQLDGYYTIAEVDAALEALQNSVDKKNEALLEDIQELSTKVDNMKTELTEAYTTAIEEAINTNNGIVDSKIADAIAEVNGRIDSEVEAINARIDALEERVEDLEEALDIEFDIESGKACMAGTSLEFGYAIVGGDEDTEVESFGDGGWRADVIPADATSGRIRVTSPVDGGNGKVIVLATSGAGASTMKSIRFEEGVLTDIADRYEVDWEACTLAVRLKTNLDYEVRIAEDAQSWLSVADTRAAVREETLTFSIAENPEDSPERTAVVELVNGCGEVLQSFEIVQQQQIALISFVDQYVKEVCVSKYDVDGDGEVSLIEAEQVTYIEAYFFNEYDADVTSFDELQYFVNVENIGEERYGAFDGCTNLKSITLPDNVTYIGAKAFRGCAISHINILRALQSIDYDAFLSCSNLRKVFIEDVEAWCNIAFDSFRSNPLYNGADLYINNQLASELKLAGCISSIGQYQFYGCNSIKSLKIECDMMEIDRCAFYECANLEEVDLGDNIMSLGHSAFYKCKKLHTIILPDSLSSIGGSAFEECENIISITIPHIM